MLVLLPCYSLEDFSLYRSDEEALEILSAVSVLYHPILLERFGKLPEWEPAGNPNDYRSYSLIVIPPRCESDIPKEWLKKKEEEQTVLIRGCSSRDDMLRAIAERLEISLSDLESDQADTTMALGLACFLSDLLSRKNRYMSDLDLDAIEKALFNALKADRQGDPERSNDELQKAFDSICETNEYYFPTPTQFLSITRVDDSKLFDDSLIQQFERKERRNEKTNFWLPETQLDSMSEDIRNRIRDELAADRLQLVGSDQKERPLYLLSQLEIVRRLRSGRIRYQHELGAAPLVYGREVAGLTHVLPQLLKLTGWVAAFLFTNDGWFIEQDGRSVLRWRGPDGSILPAMAKSPLNGEKNEVFLEQLDRMGYSYGGDNLIVSAFMHRPGRQIQWLEDLARINRFAPILGETVELNGFFQNLQKEGKIYSLEKDDFRTNFLTRTTSSDPISFWSDHYTQEAAQTIEKNRQLLDHFIPITKGTESEPAFLLSNPSFFTRALFLPGHPSPSLSKEVASCCHSFLDPQGEEWTKVSLPPLSRMRLELECDSKDSKTEKECAHQTKGSWWNKLILRGGASLWKTEREPSKLVEFVRESLGRKEYDEYYALRNEYFEIEVDPTTGAIRRLQTETSAQISMRRGLLDLPGRGNRFAFQIAMRLSEADRREDPRDSKDGNFGYTIMCADHVKIRENGPCRGCLAIEGRLMMPDGRKAAEYELVLTVARGSRQLDVHLELRPELLPGDRRWENYYGCRFAWKDRLAEVRVGVHEAFWRSERDYLQAPEGVDIRSENELGITILSKGLPFYRRYGLNRLDSVLITKDESKRSFDFGLGIDLEEPIRSALAYFMPEPEKISVSGNGGSELWQLLTLRPETVCPLSMEWFSEKKELALYLLETRGKKENVSLSLALPWEKVERINALGECWTEPSGNLTVKDDRTIEWETKRYEMTILRFSISTDQKEK